jgi:hypothetical protein
MCQYLGRAGANITEPDFTSLLYYLKKTWNSDIFTKETEPIVSDVATSDLHYARSGKNYNY